VIAGRPGAGESALARALRRFDPDGQVRLLDFVPAADLPALYSLAEMLVFPSFYEGFGLPLLEAMAQGVPIVSSAATALPEVAGDAALYADPHDPHAIAARIEALLDDPALALRLRTAGRARVERFTWRAFALRMRAAIESAAA
jgi:alpha-1,3-rhamnosyl/mannosyltransferase